MTTWLQHSNLEGDVVASSSAFALPVQNRFSVLGSTVRDIDDLMSTVVVVQLWKYSPRQMTQPWTSAVQEVGLDSAVSRHVRIHPRSAVGC